MATKDAFDRANPNTIADLFRKAKIGKVLRGQIPQVIRANTPVADDGVDSTLFACMLPNDAKASAILRAYARSGVGTPGELTIVLPNVVPAASEIAVAPNGDIVTLAADAWESLDVTYVPERGDVVEYTATVDSDAIALPSHITDRGVIYLLDALVTTGAPAGRKEIVAPGTAPAAGQAALDDAKEIVNFAAGEATEATLRLLIVAADDLGSLLESGETTI
jgi:hypothetical protein